MPFPTRYRGLPSAAGLFLGAVVAGAALADTDFTDLTETERSIFHAEIREALLGLPRAALPDAPPPAINLYQDAIDRDLARLSDRDTALFGPHLPGFGPADAAQRIALFTAPDCPDCARAEADLRALAETHDLRVTLLDMAAHADLARALELDLAPSYVLPDMMLRGHIPRIVLERYLTD